MNSKAPLRALTAWLAGVMLAMLAVCPAAAAVSLPPQFDDALVTQVDSPTAFAFTPDARMLVTSQYGTVHLYADGWPAPATALNLSSVACTDRERGVLGIAVDPDFTDNHFVYVYYTFKRYGTCGFTDETSPANRVSRFVLEDDNSVDPSSEVVLIDNIPSTDGYHNGGDLQFGPDGYLYVSVGDGGCDFRGDSGCHPTNDAARDLGGLSGKILRITRDGEVPAGNPYTGGDSDVCAGTGSTTVTRKCREIYSWGLRNPYRIAFDPNATGARFFINDVGEDKWEEIDEGLAAADYGWNEREGFCVRDSTSDCGPPPIGMTNPIHSYSHGTGCASITAGAFVPDGVWPSEYDGTYLFGDYVCGKLFALTPDGAGGYASSTFATDAGAVVAMRFAPYGASQALFYLDYVAGEVRRITHTPGNRAPNAMADSDLTGGDVPLSVTFDAGGSNDPDGDTLTYEWDFGDGSAPGSGESISHTYTQAGVFTAKLTVRDPDGASDSATVTIYAGNDAPAVSIDGPLPDKQFFVGEQIVLSASAIDPEEGVLPGSAFTWKVIRVHNGHTHPFMAPTKGNDIPLVAPGPESLSAAATSSLAIELTVQDAGGRVTTVTQALHPRLVELYFDTSPAGLYIDVAGQSVAPPTSVTSWQGLAVEVTAYDQAASNEEVWAFAGWSDGGDSMHTITTPAVDMTYLASFALVSAPPRPPPLQAFDPPAPAPWTAPKGTGTGSALRLHIGGSGRDRLVGTSGRDRACGRGGADVISLAGGNDVGYGGECGATGSSAGRAVSMGGTRVRDGNDVLRGGPGRDHLYGNGAHDVLSGGPGADRLTGNGGNDRLIGDAGADRFDAGPGDDVIEARDGRREIIDCGAGRDRVVADRQDVLRECELPRPAKKKKPKRADSLGARQIPD